MQKLTDAEFDRVMKSPEDLAAYLATLSPGQIGDYLSRITADKKMPLDVRKTLVKLFTQLLEEASENQALIEKELMPPAIGIATAMKLLQQIEALEGIAVSL